MTPKQEAALREYLQEAIVPLIEQVLVKKLGQAMSFAAEELIEPKPASKPWVGLNRKEFLKIIDEQKPYYPDGALPMFYRDQMLDIARAIEAKLRDKNAQPSKPLTDEQRKAIVVCFTSGKVSVSEVQRKLAISYNEAQKLCQSIVDLGIAEGLQLAPSLDRHGIKGEE